MRVKALNPIPIESWMDVPKGIKPMTVMMANMSLAILKTTVTKGSESKQMADRLGSLSIVSSASSPNIEPRAIQLTMVLTNC
jgi:hypothetical protein